MLVLFLLLTTTLVGTHAFIPLGGSRPQTPHLLHSSTTDEDGAFMDELRQRLGAGPFRLIDTTETTTKTTNPSLYYIIKIAHKGVHSIEYPQGSGNNVVLAFCDAAACRKFAASLREQSCFAPAVVRVDCEVITTMYVPPFSPLFLLCVGPGDRSNHPARLLSAPRSLLSHRTRRSRLNSSQTHCERDR